MREQPIVCGLWWEAGIRTESPIRAREPSIPNASKGPKKGKRMQYRSIALFLLLFCLSNTAAGQENKRGERGGYVIVPNELVLLVIASQPKAPIRFEEARLLMSVDGRDLAVTYNLYNSGAKPIRYLTAVIWTSFGTGGTLTGSGPSSGAITDKLIQPGETLKENGHHRIVPLTTELREKLKLRDTVNAMVVLMIKSITFADGTVYSDESTVKATQSYFEGLSDKMSVSKP